MWGFEVLGIRPNVNVGKGECCFLGLRTTVVNREGRKEDLASMTEHDVEVTHLHTCKVTKK